MLSKLKKEAKCFIRVENGKETLLLDKSKEQHNTKQKVAAFKKL